jgi:hypothetical protein
VFQQDRNEQRDGRGAAERRLTSARGDLDSGIDGRWCKFRHAEWKCAFAADLSKSLQLLG